LKKLFLIFAFLITFVFGLQAAHAQENVLHTITLEKNNTGYNIILGSDSMAKVNKKYVSQDEMLMTLTGITSSETVNALYKGTNDIQGLVIENSAPNKLKIRINAKNVKDSTVIIEPINGKTTIVGETLPMDKILWALFVVLMFGVIFKISKEISEEENNILIKKDIKDREIQLYKKYRSEMTANPIYESKNTMRMRKMIKKIDRKIDERLTSVIK